MPRAKPSSASTCSTPGWRRRSTAPARAALAWTEALTLVSRDQVPDDVYDTARKQFSERELVDLSLAVVVVNGWNRLVIGLRSAIPGTYCAGMFQQ